MRNLARQLGYEVMSLYNHVRNKDDLLEGMVDRVAAEVALPDTDDPWRPRVRDLAIAIHEMLLRHPWASALWSTAWPGRHRWDQMEAFLGALADAELPDDVADLGFHAVTLHISGFTQQQLAFRAQAAEMEAMMHRFDDDVDETVYPLIHAHLRYHEARDAGRNEPADEFGFVLDLILDGLEHARAAGRPAGEG